MTLPADMIAVDWGTTNRRVFVIENGCVARAESDGRGVTSMTDFAEAATELRASFGDKPLLMAGMVGSNIGWRAAPYVAAPACLADIAANLLRIDDRTAIVPGVSNADPPDVMRGEEVQVLGAVAGGLVPQNCDIVQPGTHSKWVRVAKGRIQSFTTVMTGELFRLVSEHSLLAPQMAGSDLIDRVFVEGVIEGSKRDLPASLFRIRAAQLLGRQGDGEARNFLSGLLIGADVAPRMAPQSHKPIWVLSEGALGTRYVAAIEALGGRASLADSQAAFVTGMIAFAESCFEPD